MVDTFVVDCSVAIAWCLKDEHSVYAQHVEQALLSGTAIAPALWPFEVANALAMAERRGRITAAELDSLVELLDGLEIAIEPRPDSVPRAIVDRAVRWKLTAYDAAYLELAYRRGVPLATIDRRLAEAAREVQVPIFLAG